MRTLSTSQRALAEGEGSLSHLLSAALNASSTTVRLWTVGPRRGSLCRTRDGRLAQIEARPGSRGGVGSGVTLRHGSSRRDPSCLPNGRRSRSRFRGRVRGPVRLVRLDLRTRKLVQEPRPLRRARPRRGRHGEPGRLAASPHRAGAADRETNRLRGHLDRGGGHALPDLRVPRGCLHRSRDRRREWVGRRLRGRRADTPRNGVSANRVPRASRPRSRRTLEHGGPYGDARGTRGPHARLRGLHERRGDPRRQRGRVPAALQRELLRAHRRPVGPRGTTAKGERHRRKPGRAARASPSPRAHPGSERPGFCPPHHARHTEAVSVASVCSVAPLVRPVLDPRRHSVVATVHPPPSAFCSLTSSPSSSLCDRSNPL